jgi:hypothetical protein
MLKLYVWRDFNRDWSSGLAVALASSLEEAKRLVRKEQDDAGCDFGEDPVEVYDIDKPIAFTVSGGA